ncbi:RlpA-like double-psi beta-barrel-protein domain-containing protein-containing protein [Papiliotrema laurentii]|uniref:RlpA-like double-psi beta-barrel-protein domain-containing protein-containing protein n=1 Tax=Papiliotrema laurentii TaxID=5418 RepID=A0AAD9FRS3_PAPLA|nr:RlpA-like double-psi beta-barrel-protein domain-containing protein-containing protein [Papiliotrema laurentii]
MLFSSLVLALLPLTLAFADPVVSERTRRSRAHVQRDVSLAKRESFNGRATFYDVGLGACGWTNSANDYIVALNTPQYGGGYPGPNCGRSITITANGVTVQATIADQCPGCPYGALDMSRGLFTRFASEDAGTFQMTWWYNDGSNSGGGQQAAPAPQPTTTTQQQQPTSTYTPPTSTYTPPTSTYTPPSSTYTPPATSNAPPASSAAPAPTTSTSSPVDSSTTLLVPSGTATNGTVLPFVNTANSTATATASSDPLAQPSGLTAEQLGNLIALNQAVSNLGNIIVVGATSK